MWTWVVVCRSFNYTCIIGNFQNVTYPMVCRIIAVNVKRANTNFLCQFLSSVLPVNMFPVVFLNSLPSES